MIGSASRQKVLDYHAASVTFQGKPRVLLADDYVALLTAWRRLLEPSCEVVGSVRNGRALLEAATELSPDVIVADLSMPEVNGLDACRQIKLASPQTKVVLVTAGGDEWVARAAFRAGASAFVLKHSAADDLLTAIQSAMLGDTYCTPMVRMDDGDLH
jgi:DNA-binding NarL/FixJ family response regulator